MSEVDIIARRNAHAQSMYDYEVSSEFDQNARAWKQDKNCGICKDKFSLSVLKKKCYFCYRGFCKKCAKHKLRQGESKKLLRCCNNCYFQKHSVKTAEETNLEQLRTEERALQQILDEAMLMKEQEEARKAALALELKKVKDQFDAINGDQQVKLTRLEKNLKEKIQQKNTLLTRARNSQQEAKQKSCQLDKVNMNISELQQSITDLTKKLKHERSNKENLIKILNESQHKQGSTQELIETMKAKIAKAQLKKNKVTDEYQDYMLNAEQELHDFENMVHDLENNSHVAQIDQTALEQISNENAILKARLHEAKHDQLQQTNHLIKGIQQIKQKLSQEREGFERLQRINLGEDISYETIILDMKKDYFGMVQRLRVLEKEMELARTHGFEIPEVSDTQISLMETSEPNSQRNCVGCFIF